MRRTEGMFGELVRPTIKSRNFRGGHWNHVWSVRMTVESRFCVSRSLWKEGGPNGTRFLVFTEHASAVTCKKDNRGLLHAVKRV